MASKPTTAQRARAIAKLAVAVRYDPFAGDYGGAGPSDRVLRDVIVTTRGGHVCHLCAARLSPGEYVRFRVEVYDGKLMTFRWCGVCTRLMASGDDNALDARVAR